MRRRLFISLGAIALSGLAFSTDLRAQTPASSDPVGIVNAIYVRVAKGNGDGGGGFIMADKAAKAKYFSKSLVALWAKADAHTPKGDVGPIDFDPVTNSQEPSVKSYTVSSERVDSASATIAVKMTTGYPKPRVNASDDVVRYDFVRDGGHWKIDDIRGATDGKPWAIRGMLTESLKN